MLEAVWSRLHASIPELGDGVEVIETASPQIFYETTRRKFGMVGRPNYLGGVVPPDLTRPFPNVFIVSDTTATGFGVASVAEVAIRLSDSLTRA